MAGSAPTNSAAVDYQKQQDAEAQQKEAERQARLQQGQTLIDQIFSGQPVMGTKTSNFDWSGFKTPTANLMPTPNSAAATPSGVPDGYTAVQVANPKSAAATAAKLDPRGVAAGFSAAPGSSAPYTGDNRFGQPKELSAASQSAAGGAGSDQVWALKDANGKIYYQGDPLSVSSQYDTGQKTGGFNDDFYGQYKQKYLDYYQPQETRQYDTAKRDLLYSLANAGLTTSSAAADKTGDLAYNDALAKGQIVSDANTATGQLKSQILGNKQSLINQLYATEDPTLTANLAQESANASRLQDPLQTPIASFFTPAMTAVGSAYQAYSSPAQPYGSTQYGQGSGGTIAPANKSSGRLSQIR